MLIPYDDERLLGKGSQTAQSPLTIALSDAGILPAAHLINGLIVISVISAGNSSLYVSSRTMLYMGRTGKAPKFLGRTNKAGVPWVALIFSNLFSCLAFLSLSSSAGRLYSALITLSGSTYSQIHLPLEQKKLIDCFSCNLHRLVRHPAHAHPLPQRTRRPGRGPVQLTVPGAVLSLRRVCRASRQRLPGFLPGLPGVSQPVQRRGLCGQLHPASRVRRVRGVLEAAEADQVGAPGGDGYLDR